MKRMPFQRPTTHYDERIKEIDERICELIKHRKVISNNNPGYPPFEYITNWAEKFDLFEELLKSIFRMNVFTLTNMNSIRITGKKVSLNGM